MIVQSSKVAAPKKAKVKKPLDIPSCSSSHQEIRYRGDKCPLCEALGDLARASDPTLKDMRYEDGQLDLGLVGGACERLMAIFASSLIGAPNYREAKLTGESNITGEDLAFTVTVQKLDGKTPHELRREAETKLAKAEAKLAALSRPSEAPAPMPCMEGCYETRFEPADPFGERVKHHVPTCPNKPGAGEEGK